MENCMINPPEERYEPWQGAWDDDDPLDAFTDDEITLFMSDPGPRDADPENEGGR